MEHKTILVTYISTGKGITKYLNYGKRRHVTLEIEDGENQVVNLNNLLTLDSS